MGFIKDWLKEYFSINEGLITTYPINVTIGRLEGVGDIRPDYKNNTITVLLNEPKSYPKLNLIMNACGWFPSYMIIDGDRFYKGRYLDPKNLLVGNSTIQVRYEAKYDVEIDTEQDYYYHATQSNRVPKILKTGLSPKSSSKQSTHPDRVYLAKTIRDCEDLSKKLLPFLKGNEMTILRIDVKILGGKVKFFRDPNYSQGVYTLRNIPNYSIEVVKTITHET